MTYKFIFFDLDDTLFDFKKSQEIAFKAVTKKLNYPYSKKLYHDYQLYNINLWQQIERGELTRENLIATRFPNFFEPLGISIIAKDIDEYFRHQLTHANELIKGASTLLKDLKSEHKRLYAASNGIYQTQMARLERTGLKQYFDGIFISEEIGYSKPHIQFFKKSFQRIPDFDLSQAIMIGDSLSSDIQGANNVSFTACWYNPEKLPTPNHLSVDYQIHDLESLRSFLF